MKIAFDVSIQPNKVNMEINRSLYVQPVLSAIADNVKLFFIQPLRKL